MAALNALRRGTFKVDKKHFVASTGQYADTFLDLSSWGKGVAFINGFNLGWYWPSIGPQNHYYIPGPILKEDTNTVVLVEMEALPESSDDLSGAGLSPQQEPAGL